MAKKNTTPVYMQVAADVAGRIVSDELHVGQKIIGRTSLASEYNVSPETIRKAMWLLEEVAIVTVKHGEGIYIASHENAETFVEQYRLKATVNELKEKLLDLIQKRDAIEDEMDATMHAIVDYASRFKNSDHITVHEYHLSYEGAFPEMTIEALDLKKNTGIALVGIRRNGINLLAPEPAEVVLRNDKLLYVGGPEASFRLGGYLRKIYQS